MEGESPCLGQFVVCKEEGSTLLPHGGPNGSEGRIQDTRVLSQGLAQLLLACHHSLDRLLTRSTATSALLRVRGCAAHGFCSKLLLASARGAQIRDVPGGR